MSLKMAPFDRPCTTSYWSAIVKYNLYRCLKLHIHIVNLRYT